MEVLHNSFLIIAVIFCFISSSAVGTIGVASYYNPPYIPSACNGRKDDGVMVAAVGRVLYNHRGICGKKYKVTCLGAAYNLGHNPCKTNNVVYVTVVDYCPGCGGQHLDLSKHAFESIADLPVGRIKIDFQLV